MSLKRPIVLDQDTARLRETRPAEDLSVPLQDRVVVLEAKLNALILWMVDQGFEIPEELIEDL